jgi:hypothetical protein
MNYCGTVSEPTAHKLTGPSRLSRNTVVLSKCLTASATVYLTFRKLRFSVAKRAVFLCSVHGRYELIPIRESKSQGSRMNTLVIAPKAQAGGYGVDFTPDRILDFSRQRPGGVNRADVVEGKRTGLS